MSKKSKFIFEIKDINQLQNLNLIMGEYLNSRGYHFEQDKNYWITSNGRGNDILKTSTAVVGGAVGGAIAGAVLPGIRGLEYYVNGNQLIIKAYLFNLKHNTTAEIHSFNSSKIGARYYGDLKFQLFKRLNNIGIELRGKEIEKINDGAEMKTALILLGYFVFMIVLVGIIMLVMTSL